MTQTNIVDQITNEIKKFGEDVADLNANTRAAIKRQDDKIDQIDAKFARVGGFNPANDNAANPVALREERAAIAAFGRKGESGSLDTFCAGMSVGSDPDGGYAVLPALSTTMTEKLYDEVPMRRLARVETITSGSEFIEPVDKDEIESGWVGETEGRDETDHAELAMLKVPLREVYALPKATQNLLDDASWDVGTWLERKITGKFARDENAAFVSGDGVKRPRGFLTYDTATTADATRAWGTIQHTISGAASTFTADGIRNLYWALRSPYRKNATWLMASASANSLDKLKDGNGEYLWRNSMASGVAPTLLGLPVEFDEGMPAVEAGALPIALADWNKAYLIVDRPGVKMLRDPYTSRPFVKFYSTKRVGAGLANSEAIKLLKISA